ncbi:C40 family peptidase [Modestobacter altitudinis]|uniref:C40 family peptidase n=1 Tax=Modestobacter altitudinis TaxID=2213158 RepID=UPI001FE6BB11|nr:C40 family peptidase [Modestobacter altitudinis]
MDTQGGTTTSTTGRRAGVRWATRLVGVAAVVATGLGVAPGTALAVPVNPSDADLSAAEQARQAAAAEVGQITAALAAAQDAAADASAAANIALQDYEEKQSAYDEARAAADAAAAAAAQADADLQGGRQEVARFARDSYKQGSTSSGALALMTSGGPSELIERAALLDAVGEQRVDVVHQLTVLEEQATAADEAARQSVTQADTLKAEAATLLVSAQDQEIAARGQEAALADQQDAVEDQLASAQQTLDSLEGQRSAAETYAQQQAAVAAAAAATTSRSTTSASSSSAASSPTSSSSSASASPSAGSSSAGQSSPGTSGSSAGTGSSSSGSASKPAPVQDTTAGAPSGSVVQTAIAAAKTQLGLPYSWGGGGSSGPSYGIPPDTKIWGFDCSGLTQYAYAQAGVQIGGTSRDQWYRFRSNTVAKSDLQAGDLVFWGSGSSYTSIYHVALYLGGGKVVQAPQSGDVVKISSMWYGSDYYGAVRPTG